MAGFYELAERALELERMGKEIIRLNVGDTNLPPPPEAVVAAQKSLAGERQGYCSSSGLMEFREKIAEREGCSPAEVVVGPGSKHLIFALMSILGKRGRVVLPSPAWPAYGLQCAQLGLKAEFIPAKMESSWDFGRLDMGGARLAIICNPLNPTGTVYPEKRVREALDDAARSGTDIVLDEAYKDLAFSPIPRYEGAIRVRSFSKEFNMEGFRLGYAVVPKDVAKKLSEFNQITATCVAPMVQRAGIACLDNELAIIARNLAAWKGRMAAASGALRENGFRFAEPGAGIYFFATHDFIRDSGEFAMRLLDRGVAVAPGGEFGGYKKFVRVCANREPGILRKAVATMGATAKEG
ncbi:MAG: pyridoxal phosphate-dependent aminotransferase [Candidatus Micrarchaeota archaeon]